MVRFCSPSCPPARRSPDPGPGQVTIEAVFSQGTATVLIIGELDLITMPFLSERLELIRREKPQRLVLDMARTGFVDCGTARLIASAGRFLPGGRRPVVRHPSPVVRRVLELTGLDADCDIEE